MSLNMDHKASFDSKQINKNYKNNFVNCLTMTITNMGSNPVTLNISGVKRTLPAADKKTSMPTTDFRMDCFGIPFDREIEVLFDQGESVVIIDYSILIQC